MYISAGIYFLAALMSSYNTIMVGVGNASLSLVAGFLDGVVFRLFFCFLLGDFLDMGVAGYFLGNSLARIGPILIHGVYFYSGVWKNRPTLLHPSDWSLCSIASQSIANRRNCIENQFFMTFIPLFGKMEAEEAQSQLWKQGNL